MSELTTLPAPHCKVAKMTATVSAALVRHRS